MDYGFPEPKVPAPTTPVPFTARLNPGCLGLLVSQVVGLAGCVGIYVWMEATNTRGWSGLGTLIKALLLVAALTLVSFFVGLAWGVKSRQKQRRLDA